MCNDLYVVYLQALHSQATCKIVATRVINFQIDIHKARLWPSFPANSQSSVASIPPGKARTEAHEVEAC